MGGRKEPNPPPSDVSMRPDPPPPPPGWGTDSKSEDVGILAQIEELFDKVTFEDFCCDHKDAYLDEEILAYLLFKGIVFVNSRKYVNIDDNQTVMPSTTIIFVNCNDIWAWGCADAEEVTKKELPVLCRMYMGDKRWGVLKWACRKRGMRPQFPIRRDMKELGVWSEMMESLEPNYDEKGKG